MKGCVESQCKISAKLEIQCYFKLSFPSVTAVMVAHRTFMTFDMHLSTEAMLSFGFYNCKYFLNGPQECYMGIVYS